MAYAVRVENPPGGSLGVLLSDMRTWMDHRGVQSLDFKSARRETGRSCFDIYFHQLQQAALFREAFGSVEPIDYQLPL